MNELSKETSPYLLQHAHNPVYWKAWNDDALASAKAQQKLLIISVGYSACHWCHVMEHETFEDATAAAVMNADFVCIKVDREERPDVDAVYMKAVQIMTGRGGWPLNVVALPDGRPVWGGTYFRKEEWIESLEHLAHMWQTQPDRMTEYADKLLEAVDALALPLNPTPEVPAALDSLVAKWKRSFDHEYGGMARAPKFMMPCNYR
ncbi:MAG TPA: thioredoxin domain-containing protein, partial [Flavobacterium sp.]|nr:thioredoxin domain-containing protein [Flavobacterium sp.]